MKYAGRTPRIILDMLLVVTLIAIGGRAFAQAGMWAAKAPMTTERYAATGGVINGKLYVAGGSRGVLGALATLEVYDPETNAWSMKAPMPTARFWAASGVVNGKLHVVGGTLASPGDIPLSTHEVYDPLTNSWETRAPMPTARYCPSADAVNGKLYVVGGGVNSFGTMTATLEVYDPDTDTWTTRASMPTARYAAASGVIEGKLYVAGGWARGSNIGTLEIYDAASDTWTSGAFMPTGRQTPAAGVINGSLYVAGGWDGVKDVSTVEAYDPASGRWTTKASLPTPREQAVGGVVNGAFYVAGGHYGGALNTLVAFSEIRAGTDVRIIDTISNRDVEFVLSSASTTPYSVTSAGETTVVEWRFDGISVGQNKTISFDLDLFNLLPGEDRLVDHSLQLIYKDLNNQEIRVDLPSLSVHVLTSSFTGTVSTDKPAYQANEDVVAGATIKNLSDYARTIDAKALIEDGSGNLVREIATLSGLAFNAGEVRNFGNLVFNTGSTSAGDYRVHIVLSENQMKIGEAFADFTIQRPAIAVSARATVDKLTYRPRESVTISPVITSLSSNYSFENLTALVSISSPTGLVLATETRGIAALMPEAAFTFKTYWNTGTYPAGVYPVSLSVRDASGTLLASGAAEATIAAITDPKALLKGVVAVDKQSVLSGEPVEVNYSITNAGNVDLTGINLTVQVLHVVEQTVYATLTDQTSLVMGATYTGGGRINTQTYSAKDYLVILQADIGGIRETLAGSYFRVEGAPTVPALSAPAKGSDVQTLMPVLTVNNASDPNDDRLTYAFEIYADSGLTTLIVSAGGIAQGTGPSTGSGQGTTSFQAPAELTENSTYFWRSRAFDGKLYGEWMQSASFRVNVTNDLPSAPTIASPADGIEVSTLTPVLTINNASDPDSAGLTYNFQVALDPDFTQIAASTVGVLSSQGTTSWQATPALSENTWYYWRSQADDWLDVGPWSSTSRFFVNTANDAPTVPVVLSPSNNAAIQSLNADIALQNSTDIDSPVISYFFEVDTVPTFDSASIIRSGVIPAGSASSTGSGQGTTTWQAIGLLDNTIYYVRARASDGSAHSEWTQTISFFINTANDAPATPTIANPSIGAGVSVSTPTLAVHNAADIDRDSLTYEFEVYSNATFTNLVGSASGIAETAGTTSWTVSIALTENQTYYWRSRAFDGSLNSGWTTGWFVVNMANDAPGVPTIVSPAEGSSIDTATPTLTVLNATDPDRDRLTYEFEVYNGTTLVWSTTGVTEGAGGNTSVTMPTALSNNTVYQWQSRAFDGDRYGPWTAKTNFTVHLQQTGIKVEIEIEPETLNRKSKGNWVMAEIELPHGYNASDVDLSSIRLEGTVPAVAWPHEKKKKRHEHGCGDDHREHEHGELKVKFRRSDVIAVLPAGNHVPVHITGTVAGTPFEGIDIIRVIH